MSGTRNILSRLRGTEKATWLIVIARVVLLSLAAALAVSAFAMAWTEDPASARAVPRYRCPMHPEVTSAAPGECSICHMALVELAEESAESHGPKPGTPDRARYVCPMHPEVTSPTPGDCSICRMALEPVRPGVKGSSSTGAVVASGTADGATFSIQHDGRSPHGHTLESPLPRLIHREVQAPAWVEAEGRVAALFYRDELVGLAPGDSGGFIQARAPGTTFEVRLTEEAPAPWDEATLKVYFRFEPDPAVAPAAEARALPDLAVGTPGWLKVQRSQELLLVPAHAVLRSPKGPYVLVAEEQHLHFAKRYVEVGQVLSGHVAVLSGLGKDERFVALNAFFLDTERRLQMERERTLEKAP